MIPAGNTKVPSYLTLIKKGYKVKLEIYEGNHSWVALNDVVQHQAKDLESLLGIVTMFEERGTDFLASKKEILDFFKKIPELKQ